GAASRRHRAHGAAEAAASSVSWSADAAIRRVDGGGGGGGDRALAAGGALPTQAAHAGADARDHPARRLRDRRGPAARTAVLGAAPAARPNHQPTLAADPDPPGTRAARAFRPVPALYRAGQWTDLRGDRPAAEGA